MSDPSLASELQDGDDGSQAVADLPGAFDFSLGDDASSLGSDSELNGMPPYRQTDRPRLLAHTLKIIEQVIDTRIRTVVQLSISQAGFIKN
ncbi:hypothetical protein JRQ81_000090 [Phrynocephalus forsythii]|uniref:Uncharacterized protein n=1 Tax=Phrynocephalus forsythii TaxID=171643 RepID=A0A9Q0Y4P4_9SAUR|nr:hypothetical protein JRQ81_000090 [Phrynocephalus forsythii]